MKKNTLSFRLLLFIVPFLVIVIGALTLGNQLLRRAEDQARQYMRKTLSMYIDTVDRGISGINQRLSVLLLGENNNDVVQQCLSNITQNKSDIDVHHSIRQIKTVMAEIGQEMDVSANFFLFDLNNERYIRCTDGNLSLREYESYEKILSDVLQSSAQYNQNRTRLFCGLSGRYAATHFYRRNDIILGWWIPIDSIVMSVKDAAPDLKSTIIIADMNDQILAAYGELANEKNGTDEIDAVIRQYAKGSKTNALVSESFRNIPVNAKIFCEAYVSTDQAFNIEFLISLFVALVIMCMLVNIMHLQTKIMRPIRKFAQNIRRIEEGYGQIEDLRASDLKYLNEANREFSKLLSEVERLKLYTYEQEIEKQSVQLDYLKLQIKPHFYLNCLNFIHSMIELKEFDQAKAMCIVTSDYLRYVYSSNDAFVYISDEIKHIGDYMHIQQLRYGDSVVYRYNADPDTMDKKIPPLLILTFIENAMKYAVDIERTTEINLSISMVEENANEYIRIRIEDSGEGFPCEFLEKIGKKGEYITNGNSGHGIDNCVKRLHFFYGEMAAVSFANKDSGGAAVTLLIPDYAVSEVIDHDGADC